MLKSFHLSPETPGTDSNHRDVNALERHVDAYKGARHASKQPAHFFIPNVTKMQSQISVQSFDMWHDYMNLGTLLKRLCDRGPEERGLLRRSAPVAAAAEGTAVGPPSHSQICGGEVHRNSPDTSSVSSLSDASSSGTSSDADFCRFCKQNGESRRVYRSHTLKSANGNVVCPILWNYTCPICGATGDYAHTRRYCPVVQRQNKSNLAVSKFW